MANNAYMKMLIESVTTWNAWKIQHPKTALDFSFANLNRAYLSFADLTGANLTGANLSNANFTDADLYGADLSNVYISGANLSQANLYATNLTGIKIWRQTRLLNVKGLTPSQLTEFQATGAIIKDDMNKNEQTM